MVQLGKEEPLSLEQEIGDLLNDARDRERGGRTRLSAQQLPPDTVALIEALERAVRLLARELDKIKDQND